MDNIFGENIFEPLHALKEEETIFESAGEAGGDFADMQMRNDAMSIALAWVDEGDFTFNALDALILGLADIDADDEIGEDEEEYYNALMAEVAGALISLGANAENVMEFIDAEGDAAGEKLGAFLSKKLEEVDTDDDTIVADYAGGADAVFESTIKVIRGGKVVLKKKRIRKFKMSAAQRQGLKKARRKAHTGAARMKRKKSMNIRKKRGL